MIELPLVPEAVPYVVGDVFRQESGYLWRVLGVSRARVTLGRGAAGSQPYKVTRLGFENWLRTAERVS